MIVANGSIKRKPEKENTFESVEEALAWAASKVKKDGLHSLYVSPKIPEKKRRNAIRKYAKDIAENDILLLYDSTVFGSGKNGLVLTKDRLYWGQDRLIGNAPFPAIRLKQISSSSMMVVADREAYRVVMARSELNIAVFRKLMDFFMKGQENPKEISEENQEETKSPVI